MTTEVEKFKADMAAELKRRVDAACLPGDYHLGHTAGLESALDMLENDDWNTDIAKRVQSIKNPFLPLLTPQDVARLAAD